MHKFVYLSTALLSSFVAALDVSTPLQKILGQAHQGPLYDYPTSFTQGIVPKGIHSHNDYWRPVPFYTALSAGAISIEADVWLLNGTLYIAHETAALSTTRTFSSLYLKPILDVLARQNPPQLPGTTPSVTPNGVYDTSSGQTLYLFVDVKTDGPTTWPVVVGELSVLREKGYLTSVNGSTLTSRPVTVIGTGNTPLNLVQPLTERDYFWDAPIPTLSTTFSNITSLVSPIASTDFIANFGATLSSTTPLNSTQLELLRTQVATAHAKGIKVRYWDQPGWPIGTMKAIWRILADEGVDLINADDVLGAAGDDW